jgi:hypothetical protein
MNALLAATAVIRVVGIAMVTNQVPNDPGIHIILPAIHGVMTMPPINLQQPTPISQTIFRQRRQEPTVEEHKAVLIFRQCNFATAPNWQVNDLPNFPGVKYVDLTGSIIQFVGNKSNAAASLTNLKLPKLKFDATSCKQMTELAGGYQWPYRNVTAMIDVPAGDLKGCTATSSPGVTKRIDTVLKLNYDTFLVANAGVMNGFKELRLRSNCQDGRIEVVIYHGPWRAFSGDTSPKSPTALDGAPHYQAYYWMTATNAASCVAPSTAAPDCGIETEWLKGGSGVGKKEVEVMQADFECSNTQWP